MIIYHFNSVTGSLCGQGVADESPLEPGVYLIPANATTIPPISCPEGSELFFENGEWQIREIPAQPDPEDVPSVLPNPSDQRRLAFQLEADVLFFKAQRGEATMEAWLAKVDEIRQRYPYPVIE